MSVPEAGASGYDAQIKVGAAGLGRTSKKRGAQGDDGAWTPGSAAGPSQPTQKKPSTIAGRMSMYYGHRGSLPMYMEAFRTIPSVSARREAEDARPRTR